ncbi:MAG: methyltransferase domain-containing protein [Burkholderiales bacterium]
MGNVNYVPETRFGIWFLGTQTWVQFVLEAAVADLLNLIGNSRPHDVDAVLDVGCGQGKSFRLLKQAFNPQILIGIDANSEILEKARAQARRDRIEVDLRLANGAATGLANGSVDILFCHQTFHHLVDHEVAIAEFFRVLKPGGLLLFAESMRTYIHSWIIRLLFRHPMDVQKSAEEYLALIRRAGFRVEPNRVSFPYLWWSRPDLGLLNRLRIRETPPRGEREETLMNLVAVKPKSDQLG